LLIHPPSSPPSQTATFGQASATEGGAEYDYTRSGNPTRAQLEAQVADLEGGDAAFAFTSGMAALAAVLRLVPAGGHVVAGDDLYGGTSRLLERVAPGVGVSVSNVDTCDVAAVKAALQPGRTVLVMLESPTNPRMQVADLRALASVAHAAGALVCVDNSVMAPTFQRPLDLGADLSMTSATKFINGHSDVMAGTVAVKGATLAARVAFLQNAEGAGLAPFDCWLTLRGLKTMDLRMRAAADRAAALAFFLDGHPLVTSVLYPGLATHPGAALHASQASSAGSLLSFTTGK
jgi:cystathionine beta-lyase